MPSRRTNLSLPEPDLLPTRPRGTRHAWLWEQFEDRREYYRKRMFGSQAVYLGDRLMFGVTEKDEPWCGLLCATSREHHPSLLAQFPFLKPHPILGKWLYLSAAADGFEQNAQLIMDAIQSGDPRFGVESKPRVRKPKHKERARSN